MSEGQVVGTISIKVTPDTSKFRRELHTELAAIEKAEEANVKVKADFDKNGLTAKVKAAAEEAGTHVKIKADVNHGYIKDQILNDLRNLSTKIKVTPEIDRSLLSRVRGGFASRSGGYGGGIGTGMSQMSNLGSPANLALIAALLPPALAILTPALVSLPAMIAGVAAPIGVLALGMGGLKKAAEGAGLAVELRDKKGNPKGKYTAGQALKEIQDGVSDVFAKGFTPIFSQLLTVARPATTAMKGVAQGIVNLTQGVVNTLTSPAMVNQMNTLFANIGGGLSAAAPGLSSFTTGLINLATQVSTHFPGLADWFNKLGEKFSNWVTKSSKDGTLDKAVSSMRPVMDSIISFAGRLVDAGLKLAADPKMGQSLKDVLDGLSNFIINSLPDLTALFNAMAPLVKMLGKFKPGSYPALNGKDDTQPGGKSDSNDPTQGGKFGKPLFPGIKTDDQSIINYAKQFGGWMNQHVIGPVDRFFEGKTQNQQGGLGGPGSLFDQSKNALGNFFTGNSQWEHTLGRNVGGPIGRFFTGDNQWEKDLGSGAGQALDGVVNGAKDLGGKITGALNGLPGQVSGIWNSIADAAKQAWDSIYNAAQNAISQVIGVFRALPGQIMGILSGLGQQLFEAGMNAMGQLGKGLERGVGAAIGAVKGALGGILNLIPHSPAPEGPLSGPGWNQLFTGGQAIGNQFNDGLKDGFQGVVSQASSLIGQVQEAMTQGVVPAGLKDNLKRELKAIGLEYDQLRMHRDQLDPGDKTGRKVISDQMKQLRTLRKQLGLQSDQLGYAGKYGGGQQGDSMGEAAQMIPRGLNRALDMGKSFAMANVNQFEQDLGISGKGAIPTIANMGLGWATQQLSHMIDGAFGGGKGGGAGVHIQVNSVDEAMQARQNILNRQAMTYAGR